MACKVRGSNPLSSTRHNAPPAPTLSVVYQRTRLVAARTLCALSGSGRAGQSGDPAVALPHAVHADVRSARHRGVLSQVGWAFNHLSPPTAPRFPRIWSGAKRTPAKHRRGSPPRGPAHRRRTRAVRRPACLAIRFSVGCALIIQTIGLDPPGAVSSVIGTPRQSFGGGSEPDHAPRRRRSASRYRVGPEHAWSFPCSNHPLIQESVGRVAVARPSAGPVPVGGPVGWCSSGLWAAGW